MGARTPASDWHRHAACAGTDPELWFPAFGESAHDNPRVLAAKAICGRCPVARECLVAALREERDLSHKLRHGIRGGLMPRERARLVRNYQAQQGAA